MRNRLGTGGMMVNKQVPAFRNFSPIRQREMKATILCFDKYNDSTGAKGRDP